MADNKQNPARDPFLPTASPAAGLAQPKKGRLPVMPLTVLLPTIGELSILHRVAPQLERRLATLQDRSSSENVDDQAQRVLEESMLNQVLQWISVETD